MNCKRCGAKIEKGCFFCDKCGQSVGTVAELEELGRMERARTKKRIFTVLFTVIFLVAGAFSATKMIYDKKNADEPTGISAMLAQNTSEPEKKDISEPTAIPTIEPTATPEAEPTAIPTIEPTAVPTLAPTVKPTENPTPAPTQAVINAEAPASQTEQTAVADDTASADNTAPEAATPADGTYIYPSDTTLFTPEFLASLDRRTARLARNELYARHGLVFKTADLKNYFSAKSWYKPVKGITTTQILHKFNSVERANHSKLVSYEKSKRWIR